MSTNNTAEDTASHILTLLKNDADFHNHCTQEVLKTGSTIPLSSLNNSLYLIENGFLSCLRDIGLDEHLHMLLQPGDFSSLPSDSEEIPEIIECKALTEVTYWKIDTAFFKKIMCREAPDGEIFAKHVTKSRKNIEEHFQMDRMHPEERIYFSLHLMMQLSSPISTNVTQLPSFVTNETIAQYALTPANYTLNVLQQLQEELILSIGVDHWLIIDVAAFHTILQAKNIL